MPLVSNVCDAAPPRLPRPHRPAVIWLLGGALGLSLSAGASAQHTLAGLEVTAMALPQPKEPFRPVHFNSWAVAYISNRALFDEPVYSEKPPAPHEVQDEIECGNPIGVASGVKIQEDVDFETPGDPVLSLTRRYSSAADRSAKGLFGEHWSSSIEHVLSSCGASMTVAGACKENADSITITTNLGEQHTYHRDFSTLNRYRHVQDEFSELLFNDVDGTYLLKRADDSEILFRSDGRVAHIADSVGNRWNYTYSTTQITIARANSTRTLVVNLNASRKLATSVVEPGGQSYVYGYPLAKDRVTSVDYPGTASDSRVYHYRTSAPEFLEGIDVGGERFATFDYYTTLGDWRYGRGKSSEHAGGAERTTFDYAVDWDPVTQTNQPKTHVTNALGLVTTYVFGNHNGKRKLTGMDRQPTANCPAAAQSYTYDANGYPDLVTGFDGVATDYDHAFNGQLIRKVEGIKAGEAPLGRRTTDYTWDTKNRIETITEGEFDVASNLERDLFRTTYAYGAGVVAGVGTAADKNRVTSVRTESLLGSTVSQTTTYTYQLHSNTQALMTVVANGPVPGAGDSITTQYTTAGDVTSITNSLGHSTSYQAYNARGQVGEVNDTNQDDVDFGYDARGRLASETRNFGSGNQTTTYEYDRFGNVAKIMQPGAPEQWFAFDAANRLHMARDVTYTNPQHTSYSSKDRVFAYNDLSLPTQISTATTAYSQGGLVCGPTGCTWTSPVNCSMTETIEFRTYDELGRIKTVADGQVASEPVPNSTCPATPFEPGLAATYFYDNEGNVTSIVDRMNYETTFEYDSLDRLVQEIDADQQITAYGYGFAGTPFARTVTVTPPAGGATVYHYDGLGMPLRVESPDTTRDATFDYHTDGRLHVRHNPNRSKATYDYDALGRVSSITHGRDTVVLLPGVPHPASNFVTDGLDAALEAALAPAPTGGEPPVPEGVDTFEYDTCTKGIGRLCHAISGASDWRSSYQYARYGAPASTTETWLPYAGDIATTVAYSYDAFGRPSSITYPDGNVASYLYVNDQLTKIDAIINGQTHTVVDQITYRANGAVAGYTFGNGLVRTISRHGRLDGRPDSITTGSTQSLTYQYDDRGQLTHIVNGAVSSATQTYGYDALARLSSSDRTGASEDWIHDPIGNRELHTRSGPSTVLNYSGTQLTSMTGSQARTYYHNAYGNREAQLDSGLPTVYAYNYEQHQVYLFRPHAIASVCEPTAPGICSQRPAAAWKYATNIARQRMFKAELQLNRLNDACKNPGYDWECAPTEDSDAVQPRWLRQYAYDSAGQMLFENHRPSVPAGAGAWSYGGPNSLTSYFWLQGEPIGVVRDGQLHYVANDHLGRPEVVTNASQTPVWRAQNLAFHREVTLSTFGELNLGLPGQYYDAENELWYNWHRYYDPSTGRYAQSDPVGLAAGANTYAYAEGSPAELVDPNGLEAGGGYATGAYSMAQPNLSKCESEALLDLGINLIPITAVGSATYDAFGGEVNFINNPGIETGDYGVETPYAAAGHGAAATGYWYERRAARQSARAAQPASHYSVRNARANRAAASSIRGTIASGVAKKLGPVGALIEFADDLAKCSCE
jgi:RHS repeat-associated protein